MRQARAGALLASAKGSAPLIRIVGEPTKPRSSATSSLSTTVVANCRPGSPMSSNAVRSRVRAAASRGQSRSTSNSTSTMAIIHHPGQPRPWKRGRLVQRGILRRHPRRHCRLTGIAQAPNSQRGRMPATDVIRPWMLGGDGLDSAMDHASVSDRYTAARLAELTATPVDRLKALTEIGALARGSDDTFAADAVERVTLIRYAESCGVPDAQIERFVRERGSLLESLIAARPLRGKVLTLEELLSQLPTDTDDAVLGALLEVAGPAPGEPVTEEDVAALRMALDVLQLGFPAEALLQMIRVFSEALARVADAENRVFHDYVHEKHRAQGLEGEELYAATDALSQPMLAIAEPALLYLHRRAMARAMREDFVHHLTEDARPP